MNVCAVRLRDVRVRVERLVQEVRVHVCQLNEVRVIGIAVYRILDDRRHEYLPIARASLVRYWIVASHPAQELAQCRFVGGIYEQHRVLRVTLRQRPLTNGIVHPLDQSLPRLDEDFIRRATPTCRPRH